MLMIFALIQCEETFVLAKENNIFISCKDIHLSLATIIPTFV